MDTIALELSMSVGDNGLDSNPNNPLSRAFSALLAEGLPHQAHTLCFLNPGNAPDSPITQPRWLGVFVHTAGGRILFFPGLNTPIDWLETARDNLAPNRRSLSLDHISAEPARQRWHFTGLGSDQHVAGGRTPEAADGSFFWFGLSLQSHDGLMLAHKRTLVVHRAPPSDVPRRLEEFRQLQGSATYARVNSDMGTTFPFSPSFLHICFLFSSPTAPNYTGPEWLPPAGSPYLTPPLPPEVAEARIRLHRIPLSDEWDIQIHTMLLPGTITVPAAFTSPGSL
jgi:hypothetical protein